MISIKQKCNRSNRTEVGFGTFSKETLDMLKRERGGKKNAANPFTESR